MSRHTERFELGCALQGVEAGEEVIRVDYQHQGGLSRYRAAHAIFVRRGVKQAKPASGEVPVLFHGRALSLRAFDGHAMIAAADLVDDGKHLGHPIERLLTIPSVCYVHTHYAKFGCYAARADRA